MSKLFTIIAVLPLALVLGGWSALVAYGESDRVRFRTFPCHSRVLFDNPQPFDVVVLGTSRAMVGISPTAVSQGMAAVTREPPLRVVSLARSWRGREQMRHLANLATERLQPSLLLVEYFEDSPVYPEFHQTATLVQAFNQSHFNDADGVLTRAHATLQHLAKRWLDDMEFLLTGKPRFRGEDDAVYPEAHSCLREENFRRIIDLAEFNEKQSNRRATADEDLTKPIGVRNRRALVRLIADAKAAGVTVMLFQVPIRGAPRFPPQTLAALRSTYGVPVLEIPDEFAKRFTNEDHADLTHATPRGRKRISDWLGRAAATALREQTDVSQ